MLFPHFADDREVEWLSILLFIECAGFDRLADSFRRFDAADVEDVFKGRASLRSSWSYCRQGNSVMDDRCALLEPLCKLWLLEAQEFLPHHFFGVGTHGDETRNLCVRKLRHPSRSCNSEWADAVVAMDCEDAFLSQIL